MRSNLIPSNRELERLASLHKYRILDTPSERVYDLIVQLAAREYEVPLAVLTFVDHDRVWTKAQYGLYLPAASREESFCARTILSEAGLFVRDAREDPRFQHLVLVNESPKIRFYAGVPISTADGSHLGALSIMDTAPHPDFKISDLSQLHLLASLVSEQLEVRLKTLQSENRSHLYRPGRAAKIPSPSVPASLRFSNEPDEKPDVVRALQILQLVMDNIPQAVFWKDRNSVYIWCNRNFAIDAGAGTPANIVGKTDFDLAFTHEEASFFVKVDQEVMSTGVPQYHIIEPQTQADGKHAWVDTNKIPLRDELGNVIGVLGTYEDITERKQSEEELRRSQQMLQLVLNNIPQAVFWKDLNSVYLGGNPSFAVDAGLDHPDQLIGLTDLDLAWTPEQADAFIQTDQRVMTNDQPEHHILEQQRQADGKLAWLDTNKIPLHDSEGNVVGILGTYEDITERKAAEEALQQAHIKLEQRVQERTAELSQTNLLLRQQILERERAELAEREQRTLAEVLRDIAVVLNSTLNLETVLDRILSEIDRVVPHDTANIILIEDQQARTVRFRGREGFAQQPPDPQRRYEIAELPNLEEMIRTRLPLIIVDTQHHPNWVTRPSTPWVRSYLGAPILFEERVIGFINLNSSHPAFFNQQHAERLQVLTHQAAIAIQNARLYAQAQELAAVEERQRLARDLHDAVSQTLWTASLIAEVLPTLWQQDQQEALLSLEKLRRLTQGALAEMRTLLLELRPTALVEAKIGDLMHQLVQATMSRKKVDIHLEVQGEVALPPDVQIGIYRVAQEALNNIVKHAHASQVRVRMICEADGLDLYVSDDGRGFNPGEVTARQLGLDIMRERAYSIGAKLALTSEKGKGTQIHLRWSRDNSVVPMEEYA